LSLWVLDTDMLTLWRHGRETIATRVASTPPQQLAVTIITVEEVLGGWYIQIRQARDDQQLAQAYQAFQQAVEFTRGIQLLPFDLPEIRRYRQLRTASCGLATVVSVQMISASRQLSSNSEGSW
jgi:tRNA(fMet)-specific endonuclease VapC